MLRIAVCVKLVPAYSDGMTDPETGLMIRSGLEMVINPYDLPAIETALRLREQVGGEVVACTLGPGQAVEVLRTACAMGADDGVLITGREFAGSDVLATSFALCQGMICNGPFDMVICGRETTDGDTSQVGGSLAYRLGMVSLQWVSEIVDIDTESVTVRQEFDTHSLCVRTKLPVLLSVETSINPPRMPSLKHRLAARKRDFRVMHLDDMQDRNSGHYGLAGSATRVEKVFPVETTQAAAAVEFDRDRAVKAIAAILNPSRQADDAE